METSNRKQDRRNYKPAPKPFLDSRGRLYDDTLCPDSKGRLYDDTLTLGRNVFNPRKKVECSNEKLLIDLELMKKFIEAVDTADGHCKLTDRYFTDACDVCEEETLWDVDPGGSGHTMCTNCGLLQ